MEGWHEWTLQYYLPTHPELLRIDELGRGVGVMDLARWMGEQNEKGEEVMKGTASKVAKRIRIDHEASDTSGLLQNSAPPVNVSAMISPGGLASDGSCADELTKPDRRRLAAGRCRCK